jgi:hypothetical protein
MTIKNAPVVHHMPGVNGCKKAQALFEFLSLIGAITTRPESM